MDNKTNIVLLLDEVEFGVKLGEELKRLKMNVSWASHEDPLKKVFDEVPHLVIVDETYKNGQGKALALRAKEDLVIQHIPIFFLSQKMPLLESDPADPIDYYCSKEKNLKKIVVAIQDVLQRSYNELDVNPFTHLPGTRSSILKMERAVNSNKLLAFACINIADFEAYAQLYGAERGDEMIVELAKIIQGVLKKQDYQENFVGHLGENSYILVTSSEFVMRVVELIIQHFDQVASTFYDHEDRKLGYILQRNKEGVLVRHPIASLSVVIIHNDNLSGTEMSEFGKITNQLNNYMKTLPGSCYIEYNPKAYLYGDRTLNASLEVHFPSKMKKLNVPNPLREIDKHKAFFDELLTERKLDMFYQPIVDLKTKQVVGYEALARCLMPSFVNEASLLFAMARESMRVKELDKLCFEMALQNAQGLGPDQKLFLNLNHESLIDPSIMKDLLSKRGKIGFKNIVIEVTEQSILRSFEKIREAMNDLREQGVGIAIDDVGGGAVSLRDVALLKPNYFKFDRSLIRKIDSNPTKQQIMLSMILFANGIQATTEAEGIETREEYETVLKCGISLGQGFYFSKSGKAFPTIHIPETYGKS